MRYRILRRRRGLLVDIPNPLQPGSTGYISCGATKEDALANARRLGVTGVEAIPEDDYRMERAS